MATRRETPDTGGEFAEDVCALLARAQECGVPVHLATARSKTVAVGCMVRSAAPGPDGKLDLVQTQSGTRFTPKPSDVRFAASLIGEVRSRPGSLSSLTPTDRAVAVSTALSGVALLLASDDLTGIERVELEQIAASIARLSAG